MYSEKELTLRFNRGIELSTFIRICRSQSVTHSQELIIHSQHNCWTLKVQSERAKEVDREQDKRTERKTWKQEDATDAARDSRGWMDGRVEASRLEVEVD